MLSFLKNLSTKLHITKKKKKKKGHCQYEHTQSLNFCIFWGACIEVAAMNCILNLNIWLRYPRNFKIHMFPAHLVPSLYLVYASRKAFVLLGQLRDTLCFLSQRIHYTWDLLFPHTVILEPSKLVCLKTFVVRVKFWDYFLEMGRTGIHMYPNRSKTGRVCAALVSIRNEFLSFFLFGTFFLTEENTYFSKISR